MHADIVEEEQRPRTDGEDVVHRQIDQVPSENVVASKLRAEQDLRADAVRAGDQDRIPHALEMEQPGEGAEIPEDRRPVGRANVARNAADVVLGRREVDPGGGVRHARARSSASLSVVASMGMG